VRVRGRRLTASRARLLILQVGLAAALATTAPGQAQTSTPSAAPAAGSTGDAASVPPASPASPQAPPSEPAAGLQSASAPVQASAREAYAAGQALFAEGKYAEAKLAFDRAYALVPNPIVLLSSAECEVRLGNIESAHSQLQRYLSERPDAPDRAQVEQKAAALQATPALLMLTSEPRGASVGLDGEDSGASTPAAIYVRPGEHQVALTLLGYESVSQLIVARMGARQALRLTLQPIAGAAPAALPLKVTTETDSGGSDNAPIWVSAILSGAAFVTGGVLGVLALEQENKFDEHPTEKTADRGEKLALFADVAFGVGIIAGITAAVLCFTGDEAQPAPNAASAARVSVSPLALSHGAGLRASGRF
jgi:hypothetical protein